MKKYALSYTDLAMLDSIIRLFCAAKGKEIESGKTLTLKLQNHMTIPIEIFSDKSLER